MDDNGQSEPSLSQRSNGQERHPQLGMTTLEQRPGFVLAHASGNRRRVPCNARIRGFPSQSIVGR
jgi:hypothetical protein